MSSRKAKITKRTVDALKPGELIWDTEVAGFAIRCQKRDKVYGLKKRINGRQRWLTIGKHGEPWTVEKARDEARIQIGDIKKGKDPAAEREKRKSRPTVKDLMKRYLEDHAYQHKKATSVHEDEANIKNHILPHMQTQYVSELSIADVDAFKRAVKDGKPAKHPRAKGGNLKGGSGAANRCLALLSKAINLAIRWGWRTDNPVTHVSKYPENKIERFLSELEFDAISNAMREEEAKGGNPYAIAALRLLIFTGARRGEILSLKWSEVHLDRGLILLGDSKTGAKPIYLNPPAQKLLSEIPKQKNNPYVICGLKEGSHLINLKRLWTNIRERATLEIWTGNSEIAEFCQALEAEKNRPARFSEVIRHCEEEGMNPQGGVIDVRIHDLRHSFASVAAASGMSLPMIGKLLGHSQAATTARYAHLADDPIKQANDAIGVRLQGLMGQPPGNNLIKIRNS
jgi:integrase